MQLEDIEMGVWTCDIYGNKLENNVELKQDETEKIEIVIQNGYNSGSHIFGSNGNYFPLCIHVHDAFQK